MATWIVKDAAPGPGLRVAVKDLIDVAGLLRTAGLETGELTAAITRMRSWLSAVLLPGDPAAQPGAVPLLNDGFPVPGALLTTTGLGGADVVRLREELRELAERAGRAAASRPV